MRLIRFKFLMGGQIDTHFRWKPITTCTLGFTVHVCWVQNPKGQEIKEDNNPCLCMNVCLSRFEAVPWFCYTMTSYLHSMESRFKLLIDCSLICCLTVVLFWGILQSFDHGYYLLVKSIQELREKKEGIVTVGIGGPSGSGKTRYTGTSCLTFVIWLLFCLTNLCSMYLLCFSFFGWTERRLFLCVWYFFPN